MLQHYKKGTSITVPTGKTFTYEQAIAEDKYPQLAAFDCAVEVSADGILSSIAALSQLKEQYGITEADPDKAVTLIIAARKAEADAAAAQVSTEQERIDALEAAVNYMLVPDAPAV
ncbi:MAG: hypothetical protein RR842_03960 [Gordonibacter sp.]|uniref:hypothetical protein n=1 Tax=Gordonibacter sp. TaxID=1968902 RepID=UPI002FC92801